MKGWNALIHTREFMLHHALAAPLEHYFLVMMLKASIWDAQNPTRHWQVRNTARTAFFKLRNDFLVDYMLHKGIFAEWSDIMADKTEHAVLVADGGLVCVSYFSIWTRKSTLLVCNLLLRSVRRLPELETWGRDNQLVMMATDQQSMEYQVFVVNNIFQHPNMVYIYKSKPSAWKESLSSLLDPTQGARFYSEIGRLLVLEALSTSCVHNKFYKLIVYSDISLSEFVSFNTITGVISEVRRPDVNSGYYIQLVVVQDHLFYVAVDKGTWIRMFEVREEEDCGFVTVMPDEFQRWVLGNISMFEVQHPYDGPRVLFVVECGRDALLFCSVLGRSMAYDLSRNEWDYYPDNWFGDGHRNAHTKYDEICGSNCCLSLCPL